MFTKLLFALLLSSLPAFGSLTWSNSEQAVVYHSGDTELHINFNYTNSGKKPAIVGSVVASCGCTTAALAKSTIEPGEKGTLTATFEVGQREGEHAVNIVVSYIDGTQDVLKFHTNITQPYKVEPSILLWPKGSPNTPKTVTITFDPSSTYLAGISLTQAPAYDLSYHPTATGCNLILKPLSTTNLLSFPIIIDLVVSGKHVSTLIYLNVKD